MALDIFSVNSLIQDKSSDTLTCVSKSLEDLVRQLSPGLTEIDRSEGIPEKLQSHIELIKQAIDFETDRCTTPPLPVNQLIRSHTVDTLCAVKETLTTIAAYFDFALSSDLAGDREKLIASGLGNILFSIIQAIEYEIEKSS